MSISKITTANKALSINLDNSIIGSFAEIGGGQEVSGEFFRAGGSSGTVAKTISAYNKVFSDANYNNNKVGRYVSENRLIKMLDKEYDELVTVLKDKTESYTRFFTFASTVETINYNKTNQGHGWLGIRFQLSPNSKPNDVIIHVILHENDSILQQNTLGILGVNLIWACYFYSDRPNLFLKSLMDNLSSNRIEINMARMQGNDLNYVDNRLLALQLVKNGMTSLTIFDRYRQVQQPSDLLYKKNVIILRGSFRPITYTGFDMLKTSYSLMKKELNTTNKHENVVLCEITLNNLLSNKDFDEQDFLDRVDLLNGMGQYVMISNFKEFYRLVSYMNNIKINNLRLVMGAKILEKILEPNYYSHLKGGVLEAFGRLFPDFVKMYIYPNCNNTNDTIFNSSNINIPESIKSLYDYLKQNNKIFDILDYKKDYLPYYSHIVLEDIKSGNNNWCKMVPIYISEQIKTKKLFGYNEKQ